MSWHTIKRAAWDFETTGVNVEQDRIVTAALVIRDSDTTVRHNWVINPGIACPTSASDIHGWTTERLQAEGVEPKGALEEIAGHLAEILRERLPLVSFNGAFDYSILHHELLRHGLPTMEDRLNGDLPLTLVDAFVLDRELDRYRPGSRKLTAVAEHYGVPLDDAHEATADALAALGVAEQIAQRYQRVGRMSPSDLFLAQQRWSGSRAASYQDWLRNEAPPEKRDPNAVIDGSWPLKTSA